MSTPFTVAWLATAVCSRVFALRDAGKLAYAGRLYWDSLRSLKVQIEAIKKPDQAHRVALIRVKSALREINFSDAYFKAGGRFSNHGEMWDDLERFQLEYVPGPTVDGQPTLGEWVAVDVDTEVHLPPLPDSVVTEDGPYATAEDNAIFREAQSGSYPALSYPERFDDHDTRVIEGWAEYLEPVGQDELAEALEHHRRRAWGWSLDVHQVFETAYACHRDGAINATLFAQVFLKLEEDMGGERWMFSGVQVRGLGDGSDFAMNLVSFLELYEYEVDEIDPLPAEEWGPVTSAQEQVAADQAARQFEYELLTHYKADPGTYYNKRLGKEMPRKWSDAYYDMAYIKAVISGYSVKDAKWAAHCAKMGVERKPTPSRTVVAATPKGLKMGNNAIIQWEYVNSFHLYQLEAQDKESVLTSLRKAWQALVTRRPVIEKVAAAL